MRRKWRARLTHEVFPAGILIALFYWSVFPTRVGISLGVLLLLLVLWTELILIITDDNSLVPRTWAWKVEKQVKTFNSLPAVGWFFETISNRVETHRIIADREEQYLTAAQIIDDYLDIIWNDFERELDLSEERRSELLDRVVTDTEQRKTGAYPILSENLLDSIFDEHRKAVEALIFASEQDRLENSKGDIVYTGEQLSDFRQGVANAFEAMDFSWSKAKRDLVTLYADYWRKSSSGEENLDVMTDSRVYEEFVGRYYPHKEYPSYEDENEQVDYRTEIVRLVQSELSIGNVQIDLLERLQDERDRIKSQVRKHEAYFICAKKIGNDTSFYDQFEDKFPRKIRIGTKYIDEPMREEEKLEIWMRIVFPEQTYGSAENFRTQALSDVISDGVMAFVSEINLPFETLRTQEELVDIAETPENVKYVLTETDLLLTGHSEEDITQQALDNLAVVNEDVEKILAALSLRSLVPDATSEEEAVFERNRAGIEKDLGIVKIFDWRTQNVEEVAAALRDVDDRDVSDRWESIAQDLIQRVDAATPPDYKEENQKETHPEPTN